MDWKSTAALGVNSVSTVEHIFSSKTVTDIRHATNDATKAIGSGIATGGKIVGDIIALPGQIAGGLANRAAQMANSLLMHIFILIGGVVLVSVLN